MSSLWNVPDKEAAAAHMPLWAGVPSGILRHVRAEDLFASLIHEIEDMMRSPA